MNLFELERLKQEGKNVILPGGIDAIEERTKELFREAEQRIDDRIDLDELMELCDKHGNAPPKLLGC